MRPSHSGYGEVRAVRPGRRSRWLWWVYLGAGILSCIGFIIVAVKVRRRRFVTAAVISVVACTVSFASRQIWPLPPEVGQTVAAGQGADSGGGNVSTTIITVIWIGLIVYGHVLNRDYKRFLRDQDNRRWRSGGAQSHNDPHTSVRGAPHVHYQPAPTADSSASSTLRGGPPAIDVDRFLDLQPPGNEPARVPPNIPSE